MSEQSSNGLERRMAYGELRAEGGRKRTLAGYAVVFDTLSLNLGGFKERIAPEAVDRTFKEGIDVRAFFDHDSGQVLGRLKAGTLAIRKDRRGLHVEIDAPDTTVGNDLLVSVERGDINQMSFGFAVVDDEWDEEDEWPIRTVTDMRVFEVSVVSQPAYPATSVGVRGVDTAVAQRSLSAYRESVKRPNVEYLKRLHRQRLAG